MGRGDNRFLRFYGVCDMYISRTPKRAALDRALNRSVAIAVGEADVGRADEPTATPRPPAAPPRPARVSLIAVGNAVGKADGTTAEGKPASSSAGQARSWASVVREQDNLKIDQDLQEVPTFMH